MGTSGAGAAQLTAQMQKQKQHSLAHAQAQKLLLKPVYTIDKLFTSKELQMAGNLAALSTVKYFNAPPTEKKGVRKEKSGEADGDGLATDDNSDSGTKTPREVVAGPSTESMAATTSAPGDERAKVQDKGSNGAPNPANTPPCDHPTLQAFPPLHFSQQPSSRPSTALVLPRHSSGLPAILNLKSSQSMLLRHILLHPLRLSTS